MLKLIKRILSAILSENTYSWLNLQYKMLTLRYRKLKYGIVSEPNQFFCPCCNTHLKTFVEFNYHNQNDYNQEHYANSNTVCICPVCDSSPRHRIIAETFNSQPEILNNRRVLIFGCGFAEQIWFNHHNIAYKTADLFEKADYHIDIQDSQLEDGSFDCIICNHVLEHVENYRLALVELFRVLSPGGSLVLTVPTLDSLQQTFEDSSATSEEQRMKLFGQADHLRIFSRAFITDIEQAGFEAKEMHGNNYPSQILPVVGPADYDINIVYLCKKPS